jgi:hypothetical protein
VLDALKSLDRKTPGAGPHPRSAEWERMYGQVITGDTCARQVGTVQRWYDAAQRDSWEVRTVAFGVDAPSAIERAVGAIAEDDDFEERMTGYLEQFIDCRWPRLYLTADIGLCTVLAEGAYAQAVHEAFHTVIHSCVHYVANGSLLPATSGWTLSTSLACG